jgi:hypothetical protein
MITLALVVAGAVFALPASSAGPGASPIVNPSFETGDLTGWTATTSGGAATVVAGGVDGAWFANITTGDANVYQIVSQVIPRLGGGAGAVNKLRGWAQYNNGDPDCFDDAQVIVDRIVAGSIASSTTVFSGSCSSIPWTQWTYNIPGQGAYRIRARIENGIDAAFGSSLDIDAHTYQALFKVGP